MIVLALLVLYGCGVLILHRRGVRWPACAGAIWWLAGAGLHPARDRVPGSTGYGMELFSIHMVQHMVLNMLAPVFLVLGAPITLLLRALPAGPGGRGRSPPRASCRLLHTPGRGVADPSGGDVRACSS